jgi:hypothetical protein
MNLEPWQWVLAVLGALLVGVSKTGIAGIGMLFVVLFAYLLPSTRQSTGVVLPLLILGDLVAVLSYRRHMLWGHIARLFPWTAVGVGIGWFTLGRIDDRMARVLIGSIVLAMVLLHVIRRRQALRRQARGMQAGDPVAPEPEHGPGFAVLVGVLAGFTTMVANAAGPLMAIYLLAMRLPKMEFVGTGAVFFLLLNLFKVPFMVGLDLITAESLRFNLLLAPAVLAGAVLGRWLLTRIDQKLFEMLALGLSALAGLKLLF